jgi:hypothetical protein
MVFITKAKTEELLSHVSETPSASDAIEIQQEDKDVAVRILRRRFEVSE